MDIHNESLVEKFIKRGAWLYLFSFLIGPLGYGIKIAISYNLSVSEVGLLYGILSFIGLISSFNDLGMIESLNYFIPKLLAKNEYEKAKSFIVYAGVVMLATSLALMSGLHFSAPWLATHYFHVPEATGIIQIFAVFLFLTNVLHFNVTIFSIYQNTKHQKWTEFFRLIVTLGFALWLTLHSTGNISAYAWAWNYGVFAATIMSLWNVWRLHLGSLHRDYSMRMNRAHIKELLEYSLWSLLALNIGIVLSQLDMQLLVFLKGTEDAGYYSNYLSLIGIPFVFTSPLVGFIFPVVSAYAGKGDTEKLTRIKTAFTRIFTVIGFVGMLMFFLYGQSLGAFLFGEKFRISGEILMYSTPFLIFNFLLQINFQILGGTGRVKERLKIMLVGLIVNLIMNLTLIPAFWPQWSAFAVGVSWIPIWYMSMRATRAYAWPFDWRFFFKNIATMGAIGLLIYGFFPRDLNHISHATFLVSIIGAALCFLCSFFLLNKQEILNILRQNKSASTKS